MLATHQDAEARYSRIRKTVLATLNQRFMREDGHAVRARLIDQHALQHAAAWANSSFRRVDWDWFEGYAAFRFRYPKRFEMALWSDAALISLTLGRPTYNGRRLRLDFIESAPDKPRTLRAFQLSLLAITAYAHALGADELRVMKPVNDEVRRYYERFGLLYVAKGDYCYAKI